MRAALVPIAAALLGGLLALVVVAPAEEGPFVRRPGSPSRTPAASPARGTPHDGATTPPPRGLARRAQRAPGAGPSPRSVPRGVPAPRPEPRPRPSGAPLDRRDRPAPAPATSPAGPGGAVSCDGSVLAALLSASRSADVAVRRAAARALGVVHACAGREAPRVAGALEALLRDPVPDVAAAAARALALVPGAGGALRQPLAAGGAPGAVQVACLEALGAVGGPEDVQALLPWTSAGPGVCETAAWAVWTICARARVAPPAGLPLPAPEAPPGS